MSNYDFNVPERKFICQFLDGFTKVVNWKEYGPAEWYTLVRYPWLKASAEPKMVKVQGLNLKILRQMVKNGLLVPEIETDKEYRIQRAIGSVIGRIYAMPKEIRAELENEALDI